MYNISVYDWYGVFLRNPNSLITPSTTPHYSLQPLMIVHWSGWKDDLSKIKLYELEVYKMVSHQDKLSYHGEEPLVSRSLDATKNTFSVTLVDPGKNRRRWVALYISF